MLIFVPMTSIYFAAVCESSRVRIDYEGSRLIEEGILILTVRVKVALGKRRR